MTASALYTEADKTLEPYLTAKGFRKTRPGEYLRPTSGGNDRIQVAAGPRGKASTHFMVLMSYYPNYLKPGEELIDAQGEEVGFPCGPYLNPVGVTDRRKCWSHRTPEALAKSLQHVLQCLEQAGLPWLESLRDPKVFAANVDPMAVLDAALAYEAIDEIARARGFYEDVMSRFRVTLDRFGEKIALARRKKEFVFVAMKLDVERELRERLQRELSYRPQVTPLPPIQ